MTEPRFQVGQMVVVLGCDSTPDRNGNVATVVAVEWDRWVNTLGEDYDGFGYWLDDEWPLPVAEFRLRPYDPPSDWDSADSVWKPEALKEGEPA